MLYKNGRQELNFMQAADKESLWGFVVNVELVTQKSEKTDQVCEYLRVTNEEGLVKDFKVLGFDQTIAGVNDFSNVFTEVRTGKSMSLIALYLTLMITSPGFISHNSDVHDINGFTQTTKDHLEAKIKELGGSLEELADFLRGAKSSAMFGDDHSKILASISSLTQTKTQEQKPKQVPKSLTGKLNDAFSKELNKSDGVEAEYSKSLVGRMDIPLSNLVDDDRSNLAPVCELKVRILYLWHYVRGFNYFNSYPWTN